MPWLPDAERVAQLGEGTSNPQRLNKTVAKIKLSKLRTSCQINYPESASKYRVAPTIGGPPRPARSNRKHDHLRRPKPPQLWPGDIRQEVSESFIGNHSGLFSDWISTSDRSRQGRDSLVEEYKQRRRSRSQALIRESQRPQSRSHSRPQARRVQKTSSRPSMMKRAAAPNRHGLGGLKQQVEAKQLALKASEKVLFIPGTILKRSELVELHKLSGFGCEDLRAVMRAFQAHGGHDPAHSAVTREQFGEVMGELFDQVTPELLDQLFVTMDTDKSGTIDYKELVIGCAKLLSNESTDERFRLIFDAYDHDGSGTISASELMRIAHERGEELADSLQMVTDVMSLLDTDGTGQISFAEFIQAGHHSQILLDAFSQLIPSTIALRKHVNDLNSIPPGGTFDWDRLRDMSHFLRLKSGMGLDHSSVSRSDFRSLMNDFFGYHDELLTSSMFDISASRLIRHCNMPVDKDGSGTIDFKELLCGLSTALRGDATQRAEFYFSLYDMDQSGSIDEDDLYRLLENGRTSSSELTSGAAGSLLASTGLADMDKDGDGKISHAEFLDAVTKNPGLLELFGQVVH